MRFLVCMFALAVAMVTSECCLPTKYHTHYDEIMYHSNKPMVTSHGSRAVDYNAPMRLSTKYVDSNGAKVHELSISGGMFFKSVNGECVQVIESSRNVVQRCSHCMAKVVETSYLGSGRRRLVVKKYVNTHTLNIGGGKMKWKLESILTSVNGKSIPHISRLQYSTGSLAEVYRQYHNTKIDKEVEEKVFEIPTGCKSVMQLGTARTEEQNLKFIQLQL